MFFGSENLFLGGRGLWALGIGFWGVGFKGGLVVDVPNAVPEEGEKNFFSQGGLAVAYWEWVLDTSLSCAVALLLFSLVGRFADPSIEQWAGSRGVTCWPYGYSERCEVLADIDRATDYQRLC